MKTLIIIPAYNEEECIEKVVNKVIDTVKNVDVLVVNDGSTDNTYNEAKKTKAKVVSLPMNLGVGGAVQTGFLYAYYNDYDYAFQIDGDGQHEPKYINQMLESLKKDECDMIIGSRFIEKTSYDQTFMRKLGNNILSFFIKIFTGRKIYDTTSGFRGVNKNIIKKFALNYPYDYPEPDTNLQVLLDRKRVIEIPVEMNKRQTGKSFASPLKSAWYMIKVTLALFIARIRKRKEG